MFRSGLAEDCQTENVLRSRRSVSDKGMVYEGERLTAGERWGEVALPIVGSGGEEKTVFGVG